MEDVIVSQKFLSGDIVRCTFLDEVYSLEQDDQNLFITHKVVNNHINRFNFNEHGKCLNVKTKYKCDLILLMRPK